MLNQKKQKPEISIIVPIYNVEVYLPKSIKSLREQTLTNIEIILVNDGSTDGCYEICNQEAAQDGRIRVFDLKRSGVSVARNVGLNHANGRYVSFIDADDWVDADMMEYLLNRIESTNADIATCEFMKEYPNGKRNIQGSRNTYEIRDMRIIDEINYGGEFSPFLFNKLFRREFIGDVRFESGVTIGEDYRFIMELMLRKPLIARGGECKYHYVQRPDSVSYVGFSNYENVCKNRKNYKETYELIKTGTPQLKDGALAYYVLQEMAVVISMVKANKMDSNVIKDVQKEVRKYLKQYLKNQKVPMYLRGCALLLCVNEKLLLIPYKLLFHKARSVA